MANGGQGGDEQLHSIRTVQRGGEGPPKVAGGRARRAAWTGRGVWSWSGRRCRQCGESGEGGRALFCVVRVGGGRALFCVVRIPTVGLLLSWQHLRCRRVCAVGESPFGHHSTSLNLQAENESMAGGVARPETYNHIGCCSTAVAVVTPYISCWRCECAGGDASDRHGQVQPARALRSKILGQPGLRQANFGICWRLWSLPRANTPDNQASLAVGAIRWPCFLHMCGPFFYSGGQTRAGRITTAP